MSETPALDLCRDVQSLCAELLATGGAPEARMLAVLARVFPVQACQRGILDPKLGVFSEGFFLRLIESELSGGAEAGLIVFRSERVEELRREKGEQAAGQVLGRLAEFLRLRQAAAEWLGRVGPDSLGLFLPQVGILTAQERAQALYEDLRQSSRLPTSAGVSHTMDLSGVASELVRLALEAAQAARDSGGRRPHTLTSRGPVAPSVATAPPAATAPSGPSLAARYQRLVLLNRISLQLFADQPFSEALAQACSTILALTQARSVAVHFCDEFGQPFPAVRHGESPAARTQAHDEEALMVARALAERRIITAGGSQGWAAAPLLQYRPEGPAPLGAVVVGFPEPRPPDPELDQTLLEISRLLRNARLAQKNLERQQVLAAVTDQSADAIYITGPDSRIVSWNAAAEQLFGYSPAEAIGKAATFLVPPERMAELEAKNAQALAEGCAKNFETVRLRKDGIPVPVEATFFLLRDEKARPFGTVRVFHDITKRKEVERMKSELVSLVTHELRTPLTSIQGCAEHILEAWRDLTCERRQHFLGVILSEAKRLGDLVTDFLDISSLEAGGLPLRPSRVDLPGLARRAAALFARHPGQVAFQVAFAPGSEKAWADEDQLYRVFVNLAGNAFKYSPPGGTVTLSARLAGADVEVSVADQGPGIPPQEQGKLFQKFYRAADPVSRQTPGTGLGLAICKGIVESHHGRIWVESAPGRGTTFRFSFPRDGLKPA